MQEADPTTKHESTEVINGSDLDRDRPNEDHGRGIDNERMKMATTHDIDVEADLETERSDHGETGMMLLARMRTQPKGADSLHEGIRIAETQKLQSLLSKRTSTCRVSDPLKRPHQMMPNLWTMQTMRRRCRL